MAVATSTIHIFIMSSSATWRYNKQKLIQYRQAGWLLAFGLVSSQLTAWFVGSLNDLAWAKETSWWGFSRADLIIGLSFTFGIGLLGIYGLFKKKRPTLQTSSEKSHTPISTDRVRLLLATGGLFFGALSALLGIGGGFLAVPLFIYLLKMPVKQAIATSLFCICITSFFTSLNFIYSETAMVLIGLLTGGGSILGTIVGSRIVLRADPEKIRRGFALLQLLVVVTYVILKTAGK